VLRATRNNFRSAPYDSDDDDDDDDTDGSNLPLTVWTNDLFQGKTAWSVQLSHDFRFPLSSQKET
jgi:hypothetical protein